MIFSPEELACLAAFDQLEPDDFSVGLTDAQRQWYALSDADRASLLAEFHFTRERKARKARELPEEPWEHKAREAIERWRLSKEGE